MRRTIFFAASLLVSAVFLWLALRDVPLASVADSIRQANWAWILVSLILSACGLWTRAIRWRGLLGFRLPTLRAFHIVNITFLLNQLPLRAGEVARSLLATRFDVPLVTAATSIVVERLLDTVLVVIVMAAALPHVPKVPDVAAQGATLFGILAVTAFAMLLALARYPQFAHRILEAVERRLPFLNRFGPKRLLEQVIDGLEPLTYWRSAAHAIGWTIVSWTFSFLTFYALERALAIQGVDLALGSLLGVSSASFSIAIPVSVASIGPFEGAVRMAGDGVGMSAVTATSLGFLFHGMTVFAYALWGTIGLLALGVSLGDVMKGQKVEETSGKLKVES